MRYDTDDSHRLWKRLVPDLVLDDGRRVADLLTPAGRCCLIWPAACMLMRWFGPESEATEEPERLRRSV